MYRWRFLETVRDGYQIMARELGRIELEVEREPRRQVMIRLI